jgi:hypothetical protein
VVLYSPGFGTSRLMGTNHVEDLVSRGYVVVTIDHTGEAPVRFPGGRVTPAVVSHDALEKALGLRVADTRFVLDQLGRLAAGNGRCSASGLMPAGLRHALDRPFLLFGAQGHSHLPQPGAPWYDPSRTSFWQHQRGWKLDLSLPEGTHGSFADYQFSVPGLAGHTGVPDEVVDSLLGTVDPVRSVRAQRAYLGAYFDQFLKGRPQPLLWKESPRHPDVEFVR